MRDDWHVTARKLYTIAMGYTNDDFHPKDPRPFVPPLPRLDHFEAYRPFLFETKEEAFKAWLKDEVPLTRETLKLQPEYACKCYLDSEGSIMCTKRVLELNRRTGRVYSMNLDEDFMIEWSREDIFREWGMYDQDPLLHADEPGRLGPPTF